MPSEPVPQPCAARAGLALIMLYCVVLCRSLALHALGLRRIARLPALLKEWRAHASQSRAAVWVGVVVWVGAQMARSWHTRVRSSQRASPSCREHTRTLAKARGSRSTRCRGTESLQTVLSSRPIHALATAALARGPANAAAAAKSARAAVQEARASRSAFHKTKVVDMRQCTAIT
jgi:hypothetical protein